MGSSLVARSTGFIYRHDVKYETLWIAETADRLAKARHEFLELSRRASPLQIRIALYLVRLLFERQQAPSPHVDAEIARVWQAIENGRLHDIDLPELQ